MSLHLQIAAIAPRVAAIAPRVAAVDSHVAAVDSQFEALRRSERGLPQRRAQVALQVKQLPKARPRDFQ